MKIVFTDADTVSTGDLSFSSFAAYGTVIRYDVTAPNMAAEQPWQNQYTFLSFGISLLLAIIVTYAIEKPAGRLLDALRAKRRK